jgi:transcriptional regulator with XRE-family HTH domain
MTSSTTRRNHLYQLRRIRGLRQKQLAMLLGYRGTSMISRFENGTAVPSLKVALLLQLALGANIAEIYVDINDELQRLILKRATRLPTTIARSIRGRVLGSD